MRAGHTPSDPRVAAVYALARELVHSRGKVANDTVNPALDAGLSVSDVLEVVGECTFGACRDD